MDDGEPKNEFELARYFVNQLLNRAIHVQRKNPDPELEVMDVPRYPGLYTPHHELQTAQRPAPFFRPGWGKSGVRMEPFSNTGFSRHPDRCGLIFRDRFFAVGTHIY